MTGQFPSCGILEHEIEGTWQKFLNNDGLEMGGEENQFKLKALAFAHWTFNKFDGRLLVCDLQGKLKFPHFQENQFQQATDSFLNNRQRPIKEDSFKQLIEFSIVFREE